MSNVDITVGVPRTSVMVAAIRNLISNAYIKHQLDSNNGKLIDNNLSSYYENVYLKEPFDTVAVDSNISTFDPYAYFFSSTDISKDILIELVDAKIKQTKDLPTTQYMNDYYVKHGLPQGATSMDFQKYLIECSPVKAWSIVVFGFICARIAARTKFIDDYMTNKIGQYSQFVILGAGLDTRALRLPFKEDSTIWEVDFPQTFAYKEQVISKCIDMIPPLSKSRHLTIPSNLLETEVWVNKFKETQFDNNKPTVWLMEGLLMYLSEEQTSLLLNTVASISARGSVMLIQTSGPTTTGSESRRAFISPLNSEFKSFTLHPEQYLEKCGFTKDIKNMKEEDIIQHYNSKSKVIVPELGAERITSFTIGIKP